MKSNFLDIYIIRLARLISVMQALKRVTDPWKLLATVEKCIVDV